MHDELAANLTLEQLATAGGVSRFRLVRLFRAAFGLPPHAYQVAQRVVAARRRLEAGRKPVEVAHDVGFCDQSHLNRQFRRATGMTPSQYARLARSA